MVSVIIPVYNRAHYIKECLDSVFKQTYNDFEVILVDDGSTDNLKEAIKAYMGRIRYIYKENGGAASARNEGLRQAKGDYVAWLDSDDRWLPFKLELQMKILNKVPEAGLVFSDFSCFTDEGGKIQENYIREYFHVFNQYKLNFGKMFSMSKQNKELGIDINENGGTFEIYWGDISDKIILGQMLLTSTVLMRSKCIDEIGFLNESYETAEDYEFLTRIAKRFKVCFSGLATTEYRRFHQDQLSSEGMEIRSNLNWLRITIELGKNDDGFYKKNKALVDLRISHCYYGIGTAFYRKKLYREALINFLKGLKINIKQKRTYAYVAFIVLRMLSEKIKKAASLLRRIVKIFSALLLYLSGQLSLMNLMKRSRGIVEIIAFHQVSSDSFNPLDMKINASLFEGFIRHLKKHYTVISLSQFIDSQKKDVPLPARPLIITFDDGYRDNYTDAYPILQKYGIPATIFLTAGLINKTESLWYDKIVCAINNSNKEYIDLRKHKLGIYSLSSLDAKQESARMIVASAKYLKTAERDYLAKAVIESVGTKECANDCTCSLLRWDEIKKMAKNGIEFGSHGMNHSILTTLNESEAEYEIRESKRIISEKTGIDVDLYAYPNGSVKDYNEIIINLLKKNGYSAACTLIEGKNNGISPFELRRFCVTKGMITGLSGKFSKSLFEAEMLGLFNFLKKRG